MSYDLTGKKFGYLTAVEKVESDPKRKEWRWRCLCECGKYTIVPSYRLRHGGVKSCGCHQRDRDFCSKKAKNNPRLYKIYKSMVLRCKYKKNENYYLYGGRGISVCEEWKQFDAFCDWALANGYNETANFGECTLDRIDSNGNYTPENCRWVSMKVQNNNRRNNHRVTFNGETKTVTQWEELMGLWHGAINYRLSRGWSVEDAICKPSGRGSGIYHKALDRRQTERTPDWTDDHN